MKKLNKNYQKYKKKKKNSCIRTQKICSRQPQEKKQCLVMPSFFKFLHEKTEQKLPIVSKQKKNRCIRSQNMLKICFDQKKKKKKKKTSTQSGSPEGPGTRRWRGQAAPWAAWSCCRRGRSRTRCWRSSTCPPAPTSQGNTWGRTWH